jgi:hypothetical protein
MNFIWTEKPNSGDTTESPRSQILRYVTGRNGDSTYIRAFAIASTPAIINGLFRKNVNTTHIGGGMWDVDVEYGPQEPPEVGEFRLRFDTGGGTVRKTHALEHIASFAAPTKTATDHEGAINVHNRRAEGTDVITPQFRWSEDWTMASVFANWEYARTTVKALTGLVNDAVFREFPAGQVLLAGVTGNVSNQNPDQTMVTFNFWQQDDVTGLTVAPVEDVDKAGWEFAWVEYEQITDIKALATRATAVHVERVYEEGDFGLLQIGN